MLLFPEAFDVEDYSSAKMKSSRCSSVPHAEYLRNEVSLVPIFLSNIKVISVIGASG